jgi:tRNA threonylcarbamoyladenosine biosynthesis protein TsaE
MLDMIKTLTNELKTKEFAKEILISLNGKSAILLFGDLGSGKTTFVKGLAETLGITDLVTSPTFVLSKIYQIKNSSGQVALGRQKFCTLVHFDLYRIETLEEVWNLGFKEYLDDPKTLTVIEWPELIDKEIAKEKKVSLVFSHGAGDIRFVEVK